MISKSRKLSRVNQRRPSKSFNGCFTCRKKKIRCDERKPTCTNCRERCVECEGYEIVLRWSNPITFNNQLKPSRIVFENESRRRTVPFVDWSSLPDGLYSSTEIDNMIAYFEDYDEIYLNNMLKCGFEEDSMGPFTVFPVRQEFSTENVADIPERQFLPTDYMLPKFKQLTDYGMLTKRKFTSVLDDILESKCSTIIHENVVESDKDYRSYRVEESLPERSRHLSLGNFSDMSCMLVQTSLNSYLNETASPPLQSVTEICLDDDFIFNELWNFHDVNF